MNQEDRGMGISNNRNISSTSSSRGQRTLSSSQDDGSSTPSLLPPPEVSTILGRQRSEGNSGLGRSHAILRYFSTAVRIRCRSPFPETWTAENNDGYGYWGSFESKDLFLPSHRQPSLIAVPPFRKDRHWKQYHSSTVFALIPAEGFHKERGQPVYYGDPVQLVDSQGRTLGRLTRYPYAGCVGPDASGGPLVVVLMPKGEDIPSHLTSPSNQTLTKEAMASQGAVAESKNRSVASRRGSLVEVCSGDSVRLTGIKVERRNQKFLGGCIAFGEDEDAYITCELICEQMMPPEVVNRPSDLTSIFLADRTADGGFLGALHEGYLYKRMRITKSWKMRYIVLTQLSLYWFDPHSFDDIKKLGKPKGQMLVKDIESVHFDQFAGPHDFSITSKQGQRMAFHSTRAVDCSRWTHILEQAMENPEWIHTEGLSQTIWRSDKYYDNPKCPSITKVSKVDTSEVTLLQDLSGSLKWGEIVSLGAVSYVNIIRTEFSNGTVFDLSLEDLNRCILRPTWLNVKTMKWSVEQKDKADVFSAKIKCWARVTVDSQYNQKSSEAKTTSSYLQDYTTQWKKNDRYIGVLVSIGLLFWLPFSILGWLLALLFTAYFGYCKFKHSDPSVTSVSWTLNFVAFEIRPVSPLDAEAGDEHAQEDSDTKRQRAMNRTELSTVESDSDTESPSVQSIQELRHDYDLSDSGSDERPENSYCAERWKTTYEFRMENGLDSILVTPQTNFFIIQRFFGYEVLGRDRFGRLVILFRLKSVDWQNLSMCLVSRADVLRHFLYLWEYIWADSAATISPQSQLVIFLDADDVGFGALYGSTLGFIRDLLAITFTHYPHSIFKIIVINCDNSSFMARWSLMKSSLDIRIRNRCREIPSEFVKARLLDLISPQVLPIQYGGDCDTINEEFTRLKKFVGDTICKAAHLSMYPVTAKEVEGGILVAKGVVGSWDTIFEQNGEYCIQMAFVENVGATYCRAFKKFSNCFGQAIFDLLTIPSLRMVWSEHLLDFRVLGNITNEEDVTIMTQKVPPKGEIAVTNIMRRHCQIHGDFENFSVVWKTLEFFHMLGDSEAHLRLADSKSWVSGSIYIETLKNEKGCLVYFSHQIDSSGVPISADASKMIASFMLQEMKVLHEHAIHQ